MLKDRPIDEIRLGSIKASIWRNQGPSGFHYNSTFSRLYKEGPEWSSSDSFGRDDLLLLAKVADRAHAWIYEQKSETPETTEQAPARR